MTLKNDRDECSRALASILHRKCTGNARIVRGGNWEQFVIGVRRTRALTLQCWSQERKGWVCIGSIGVCGKNDSVNCWV